MQPGETQSLCLQSGRGLVSGRRGSLESPQGVGPEGVPFRVIDSEICSKTWVLCRKFSRGFPLEAHRSFRDSESLPPSPRSPYPDTGLSPLSSPRVGKRWRPRGSKSPLNPLVPPSFPLACRRFLLIRPTRPWSHSTLFTLSFSYSDRLYSARSFRLRLRCPCPLRGVPPTL